MDSRKRMGKDKNGVIFPVAPNLSEMSDSYLDFIEAVLSSETSLLCGNRIESLRF